MSRGEKKRNTIIPILYCTHTAPLFDVPQNMHMLGTIVFSNFIIFSLHIFIHIHNILDVFDFYAKLLGNMYIELYENTLKERLLGIININCTKFL